MSSENWTDIEAVSIFLQSSNWEAEIGGLLKSQLLLIAEYLHLEVAEGTKKEVLLKVVDAVKASKEKKESELLDEPLLLDKQFQLQEKEVEKLKLQAQLQEQASKENELERAREREREQERVKEREHELEVLRLRHGWFKIGSILILL